MCRFALGPHHYPGSCLSRARSPSPPSGWSHQPLACPCLSKSFLLGATRGTCLKFTGLALQGPPMFPTALQVMAQPLNLAFRVASWLGFNHIPSFVLPTSVAVTPEAFFTAILIYLSVPCCLQHPLYCCLSSISCSYPLGLGYPPRKLSLPPNL